MGAEPPPRGSVLPTSSLPSGGALCFDPCQSGVLEHKGCESCPRTGLRAGWGGTCWFPQAELPRLPHGRASSSRAALALPPGRHVPALRLAWRRVPASRAGAAGASGLSVSGPPGPRTLFCSEPTRESTLLPCSLSPQVRAEGPRTRVAWLLLWLGSRHVSAVTRSRFPSLLFALPAPTARVPWPQRGADVGRAVSCRSSEPLPRPRLALLPESGHAAATGGSWLPLRGGGGPLQLWERKKVSSLPGACDPGPCFSCPPVPSGGRHEEWANLGGASAPCCRRVLQTRPGRGPGEAVS